MFVGFITAAQPMTSVMEVKEPFCPVFDKQKWKRTSVLIWECWEDGLGQFFGSRFDQLMWRRAYLDSDLQLFG